MPVPIARAHFRTVVRDHWEAIGLSIAFFIASMVARRYTGTSTLVDAWPVVSAALEFAVVLVGLAVGARAGWFATQIITGHRPAPTGSLFVAIWRDLRDNILSDTQRVAAFATVFAIVCLFMAAGTTFRQLIPALNPFAWDHAFMLLDRSIHFGHDPWRLLQPVLGFPIVTVAINLAYNLWLGVLFAVLIWQAWSESSATRTQFLLTMLAAWVLLGATMAVGLSSAGPCFYGRVTGLADPYAPQMEYLRHVDQVYRVWALSTQEALWQGFSRQTVDHPTSLITAMPSMHVSMATLFACVAWKHSRRLGIALTAFALIIQVGSVHLAWHYAVDGYVSAAATALVWCAAGAYARRRHAVRSTGALGATDLAAA